jgi:hypothetical protein
VFLAFALVLACSSDDDELDPRVDPVLWDCTIETECDGTTDTTYVSNLCAITSQLEEDIDADSCAQELLDAGCTTAHCQIDCFPSAQECVP